MPLPILRAHKLTQGLAEDRKSGRVDFLRPDSKSQVSVLYEGHQPREVTAVVVSTQLVASGLAKKAEIQVGVLRSRGRDLFRLSVPCLRPLEVDAWRPRTLSQFIGCPRSGRDGASVELRVRSGQAESLRSRRSVGSRSVKSTGQCGRAKPALAPRDGLVI